MIATLLMAFNVAVEDAEYVDRMVADLSENKFVIISFCATQDEDFVRKLRLICHDEFFSLVNPILNNHNGTDGIDCGSDIKFTKLATGLIKCQVQDIQMNILSEVTLTPEQFRRFAEATVEFGAFMCDDGEEALNI
jgi:hypothetical protein